MVEFKHRKVVRSPSAPPPPLRALAPPHRLERVSSRNMRHMQTRSRKLLRQSHIALHDRGLCRGFHAAQPQPESDWAIFHGAVFGTARIFTLWNTGKTKLTARPQPT